MISDELVILYLDEFFKFGVPLDFNASFIYYFIKEVDTTVFHEFFHQIKDKINLKAKSYDDLNFYEIGPRSKWNLQCGCNKTNPSLF